MLKATKEHALEMASIVREMDKIELRASNDDSPEEGLLGSLRLSSKAWTVMVNNDIVGMAGVVPYAVLTRKGCPWFISTIHMEKYPRQFVRMCKEFFHLLPEGFNYLENYVDARYLTSVRWLEWLGFDIHEASPIGHLGVPFHRISMEVN